MKKIDLKFFYERPINFAFSFDEIKELAIKKWGREIGIVKPSFFPTKGNNLILLNGAKRKPNSHESLEFLTNNNFFPPNVHGLVLLELLDNEFNFLPDNSWVLGIDHLHHLSKIQRFGHLVPCLRKDSMGVYTYNWFPWASLLDHDEYILGLNND